MTCTVSVFLERTFVGERSEKLWYLLYCNTEGEDEFFLLLMDKKSRILLIVAAVALILSIGATFWRIVLEREYPISFESACDPASEQCFVKTCTPADPANNPCSDEKVTAEYYKMIKMQASVVPACTEASGNCAELACGNLPANLCEETLCDESSELSDGVTCNDPATYQTPSDSEGVSSEVVPLTDAPAETGATSTPDTAPASTPVPASDTAAVTPPIDVTLPDKTPVLQ
jgi:hypothetical protein